MSGIGWQVLLIVLLILLSGVFAMSEIAVVSSRKARLQQRADDGDARARRALALAENPNRFLATVQIGITLVGIFAGAYGGATLAGQIDGYFERIPVLAPYSEEIALGLVVLAITYLSLVVGEPVPKRIGLNHPETIASFVAGPMNVLSVVAAPLVRVLSTSRRTGFASRWWTWTATGWTRSCSARRRPPLPAWLRSGRSRTKQTARRVLSAHPPRVALAPAPRVGYTVPRRIRFPRHPPRTQAPRKGRP